MLITGLDDTATSHCSFQRFTQSTFVFILLYAKGLWASVSSSTILWVALSWYELRHTEHCRPVKTRVWALHYSLQTLSHAQPPSLLLRMSDIIFIQLSNLPWLGSGRRHLPPQVQYVLSSTIPKYIYTIPRYLNYVYLLFLLPSYLLWQLSSEWINSLFWWLVFQIDLNWFCDPVKSLKSQFCSLNLLLS